MRKLVLFFIFITFSSTILAKEIYQIDSSHTSVTWRASHFGFSRPSGKFSDISGKLEIDRNKMQNSNVEISINTDSLTTGLSKFDEHLKSADFFDTQNHPTITFKSVAISPYTKTKSRIRGKLNLLGVEKMVTLKAKLNKEGENPVNAKETIGFSGTAKIKRSEFGMKFGLPGIADEVEIAIELEATLIDKIDDTPSNRFMKKTSQSKAPKWNINPEESKLQFIAYQNNSNIDGSFKEFDGEIFFDKNDLDNSKIKVDVYTNSIHMPFANVIDVVKSNKWLSTKTFRKATFESTRIYPASGPKQFYADGYLTIKDHKIATKLKFILNEYTTTSARITGSGYIKRSRFKIGPLSKLASKGVADKVTLNFEISATRN